MMLNAVIQSAYPQALAKLIAVLRDIHLAEDFLQSAIEQALINWPKKQPDNPVAWLVTVARNRYIDYYRKQQKQVALHSLPEPQESPDLDERALLLSYNDDLLRLLFTCCHPALNVETQIALALKHILGLDIEQIANALVIKRATIEQRLLRAKKKISANQIQYQIPSQDKWPQRLQGVLKTIYLLFNEGYFTTDSSDLIRNELCLEAIRLARLLHAAVKNEAEIIGLLALMLQQEARSPARVDSDGNLILLADQNRNLWKSANIQEANVLTEKALLLGKGTPYALQAAIASLHNNALSEETTDWQQIYGLYQLLLQLDSSPVIELNAAIALAKSGHLQLAIERVNALKVALKDYRHWHTCIAGLYFELGDFESAHTHYQSALKHVRGQHQVNFMKKRITQCLQSK